MINKLLTLYNYIKPQVKIIIDIICLFSLFFIAYVVFKVAYSESVANIIFVYNPLFSGFMHSNIYHLSGNLMFLFIGLLFKINKKYTFNNIFVITFIISLIYFPFGLIFECAAIGLSGTAMFMLTRACLDENKWWLFVLYVILIYPDITKLFSNDDISHATHIIGALVGILSLYIEKYKKYFLFP